MFDSEFFPTPVHIIEQMVYGVDLAGKTILEPEAGKGDIVDFCIGSGAAVVLACETNPDLRRILSSKAKLIAEDFMSVTADKISHIDAIIMNPPFSNDRKHITHAFNIAPAGCDIIALCNYESYGSTFNITKREFKTLVDSYGSFEDLGSCFDTAERRTMVRVGLVRLKKPGDSYDSEFSGFFMEDEPEEVQSNGIMPYNLVRELVNRYVAAIKLFDKQMEVGIQMHELTSSFYSSKLSFTCTKEGQPTLRNDFKKDLQKSGWQWIFDKMNMGKYATQGLKADINKFVEKQHEVPFTMRNIYKMIEIVIGTTSSRMDKALIEVFDKLTKHHDENRYNLEGWKTNSHYLVNRKFIMPWLCPQDKWNVGSDSLDISWGRDLDTLEDFIKALCYMTGRNYDTVQCLRTFVRENKCIYGQLYSWEFFEFRGYKKGTMHFRFLEQDIWATFNQHVARIKGYPLPESVEKKEKNKTAA